VSPPLGGNPQADLSGKNERPRRKYLLISQLAYKQFAPQTLPLIKPNARNINKKLALPKCRRLNNKTIHIKMSSHLR
jgi:hypothetical protein